MGQGQPQFTAGGKCVGLHIRSGKHPWLPSVGLREGNNGKGGLVITIKPLDGVTEAEGVSMQPSEAPAC